MLGWTNLDDCLGRCEGVGKTGIKFPGFFENGWRFSEIIDFGLFWNFAERKFLLSLIKFFFIGQNWGAYSIFRLKLFRFVLVDDGRIDVLSFVWFWFFLGLDNVTVSGIRCLCLILDVFLEMILWIYLLFPWSLWANTFSLTISGVSR